MDAEVEYREMEMTGPKREGVKKVDKMVRRFKLVSPNIAYFD